MKSENDLNNKSTETNQNISSKDRSKPPENKDKIELELDEFESMFDSEESIELEKKLEKLIDREIKKRIVKTTKSTLLKISIGIVALILVVNPIVKSFYPDFNALASNDYKFLMGLEPYKDKLMEKIINLVGVQYEKRDDIYTDSKLKEMVSQFISNTNPYSLLEYIIVKDKGFAKYEMRLGIEDAFNSSGKTYHNSNKLDDILINYTRGETERINYQSHRYLYDYTAYSYPYMNKKEMLDELNKLADSSQVFASIKLKEPQSILSLARKLEKNFTATPFWIRVVSMDEYRAIKKEDEDIIKSKKDTPPETMCTELGINMVTPYKIVKEKNKNKEIDGEDFTFTEKNLSSDLENLTEKSLKNIYLKQIDLIAKNIDVFKVFCQIPLSRNTSSEDSKYSLTVGSINLDNDTYAEGIDEHGNIKELKKYTNSIKKEDILKTNLFTISLNKKHLISLLEDDSVEGLTILNEKSSPYIR